jgi:SecD/SecF fusion protein
MVKWGRLTTLIVIVAAIIGLLATVGPRLARQIPLGLDLKGGISILYQIGNGHQVITTNDVTATVAALTQRVDALGVTSPSIEVEQGGRVRVDLAGSFNQAKYRRDLSQQNNLEFKAPDGKVLLSGQDVMSNAAYTPDQTTGAPEVAIQFKNPAQFAAITKEYVGQPVSIWFDNKELEAPTIQNVITGGHAVITGFSSIKAAEHMAALINAGALPLPLTVLSALSVGPSLGQAALQATLQAGLVAIIVIFAFMIFMYRVPGLIAVISLSAYSMVLLVVFAGFPVTLTLTGLAALVLGIGMAVDANIITYERIKDEFRNGRSIQSAVVAGQRKALRTILDSNVTTFIAGLVMYAYGTGDVRGFAVALLASIITSLLTAVFLSRSMLMLLTRSNLVRSKWLFGASREAVTAE